MDDGEHRVSTVVSDDWETDPDYESSTSACRMTGVAAPAGNHITAAVKKKETNDAAARSSSCTAITPPASSATEGRSMPSVRELRLRFENICSGPVAAVPSAWHIRTEDTTDREESAKGLLLLGARKPGLFRSYVAEVDIPAVNIPEGYKPDDVLNVRYKGTCYAITIPDGFKAGDNMEFEVESSHLGGGGVHSYDEAIAIGDPQTADAAATTDIDKEVRFVARHLELGTPDVAGRGIKEFLGLGDHKTLGTLLQRGAIEAIQQEFTLHGSAEDKANLAYVLHGVSQDESALPPHVIEDYKRGAYHGGSLAQGDYDFGHAGYTFASFCEHKHATLAGLSQGRAASSPEPRQASPAPHAHPMWQSRLNQQ